MPQISLPPMFEGAFNDLRWARRYQDLFYIKHKQDALCLCTKRLDLDESIQNIDESILTDETSNEEPDPDAFGNNNSTNMNNIHDQES